MNAETVALVGRFTVAILALFAGTAFVFSGVSLYRQGISKRVGNLKAVWGDRQFVLNNAAPGSFLGVAGVSVIITSMVTLPDYKSQAMVPSGRPAAGSTEVTQQFSVPIRNQFAGMATSPDSVRGNDTLRLTVVLHEIADSLRLGQTFSLVDLRMPTVASDRCKSSAIPSPDGEESECLERSAVFVKLHDLYRISLADTAKLGVPGAGFVVASGKANRWKLPNFLAIVAAFLCGGIFLSNLKPFLRHVVSVHGKTVAQSDDSDRKERSADSVK